MRASVVDGDDPIRGAGEQDVEVAEGHAAHLAGRQLVDTNRRFKWRRAGADRGEPSGNGRDPDVAHNGHGGMLVRFLLPARFQCVWHSANAASWTAECPSVGKVALAPKRRRDRNWAM